MTEMNGGIDTSMYQQGNQNSQGNQLLDEAAKAAQFRNEVEQARKLKTPLTGSSESLELLGAGKPHQEFNSGQ